MASGLSRDGGGLRDPMVKKYQGLLEKMPELGKYKRAWKTAVLLYESNLTQEITTVLDKGVTDICLPLPENLVNWLLGPAEATRFLGRQMQILTDTFIVGKEERPSEHFYLKDNALDRHYAIPTTLEKMTQVGENNKASVVTGVKVKNETRPVYALKRITRLNEQNGNAINQLKYVQGEIDALRKIRHLHYVKILGSYTTRKYVGILMSPLADHNLGQFLDSFQSASELRSQQVLLAGFFGCLAAGLYKLHYKYKIRHKDIKPENILVKGENVLLADFGIALDWSDKGRTTTDEETLRSPIYCAPEVGNFQKRGSGSDIWALGCVFLEMATVLKGHTRKSVKETLESTSSGSVSYWKNIDGIKEHMRILGDEATPNCGNTPLRWIDKMLRERREDRCSAAQLIDEIRRSRGLDRLGFCGMCCRDGDAADSEDEESTDLDSYQEKMDDERLQSEPVRILDQGGCDWHDANMFRYMESSKNWISPSLVNQCHLNTRGNHYESILFEGRRLESTGSVWVTWMPTYGTKVEKDEFLVSTSIPPFDVIVGNGSGIS